MNKEKWFFWLSGEDDIKQIVTVCQMLYVKSSCRCWGREDWPRGLWETTSKYPKELKPSLTALWQSRRSIKFEDWEKDHCDQSMGMREPLMLERLAGTRCDLCSQQESEVMSVFQRYRPCKRHFLEEFLDSRYV